MMEVDGDSPISTQDKHSSLLRRLPEFFYDNHIFQGSRRPERTNCETDEGLVIALNRRFHYRGRSVHSFRPREKVNPVHGLIRMLNRSLRRPPGVNEIVRINPKYDIVLEEKPADKPSQFERRVDPNGAVEASSADPENHYVLRDASEGDNKKKRVSTLWKDPCNRNVYPLRFSTLHSSIIENILKKWPDDVIVPVHEAKNHAIKSFSFCTWNSGEKETNQYLMDEDCKVIVLVGVLISLTSVSDKFVEQTCQKYRMLYLPTRPMTREWKSGQFSDGEGKSGVHLLAKSSSGLNFDDIVSGIPCAIKGFAIPGNGFVVADIAWATPKPCIWPKISGGDDARMDFVFISGLEFGPQKLDSIEIDLLKDYLLGLCGSPDEQKFEMMPKTRVFFVGNSFGVPSSDPLSPKHTNDLAELAEQLDSFFSTLAETMEVFLIPGETDVSEKLLPQKPMQPMLFPRFSDTEVSHSFHNPCRLKMILDLEDPSQFLDLICSSGSNITEVRNYVGEESTLFISENMLKWGHINPAVPDFFPVENIPKSDVFAVVENLPHLYVIGNQEEFGVREFNNTKIISVPTFSKTHQIVTLQLTKVAHKIVPMEFKVLDFDF